MSGLKWIEVRLDVFVESVVVCDEVMERRERLVHLTKPG